MAAVDTMTKEDELISAPKYDTLTSVASSHCKSAAFFFASSSSSRCLNTAILSLSTSGADDLPVEVRPFSANFVASIALSLFSRSSRSLSGNLFLGTLCCR